MIWFKVVIVVFACAMVVQAHDPHGDDVGSPGFTRFCQRLVQQKLTQLLADGADGGEATAGDTILARTVSDDGVSISVENNAKNVVNNNVKVTPVILNIANINLDITSTGTTMFLPFNALDMNALQKRVQTADDAKMAEDEGINVFVPKEKMSQGLVDCISSAQINSQAIPATVQVVKQPTNQPQSG